MENIITTAKIPSLQEQAQKNYDALRYKAERNGRADTAALASAAYSLLREKYQLADALYEDTIVGTVGNVGLYALRKERLIEGCGWIDGRKLYAM